MSSMIETIIAARLAEGKPIRRTPRYRRMPRLTNWNIGPAASDARQKHCDRNGGHVLVMQEGRIVCTVCDAEWRDEGD